MEKLRGAVVYQDGHVEIERLRAVHGRVTLATRGTCDLTPAGGWRLRLFDMTADRLRADRDLLQALPGSLKKAVEKLNPSGPITVSGNLELGRTGPDDQPLTSAWDLKFEASGSGIDAGLRLDGVHGG